LYLFEYIYFEFSKILSFYSVHKKMMLLVPHAVLTRWIFESWI